MIVLVNSSILIDPSLKPLPNWSVVIPIALATCLSCAGIAIKRVLHSIISGLPFENAWLNCSIALDCISALAPPANIALLTATNSFSLFLISPLTVVNLCTALAPASSEVGSPLSSSLKLLITSSASSPLIPKLFITFGKLFIVSYLLIALSIFWDITLKALLIALAAICPNVKAVVSLPKLALTEFVALFTWLVSAVNRVNTSAPFILSIPFYYIFYKDKKASSLTTHL